jgi:hypothetical protein
LIEEGRGGGRGGGRDFDRGGRDWDRGYRGGGGKKTTPSYVYRHKVNEMTIGYYGGGGKKTTPSYVYQHKVNEMTTGYYGGGLVGDLVEGIGIGIGDSIYGAPYYPAPYYYPYRR